MENGQFDQATLLIQLSQHVPTTYKHHRAALICTIMNSIFSTSYEVSTINQLLAEADAFPSVTKELCGKPSERILWEVSISLCF